MARASWDRQLEAYTTAAGGSTPPPQRAARARMADAVRAAPESPEAWAALLAAEEAALGASTGTLTGERGAGARGGVSLFDLYAAATKAVPRANNYANDAYVRIWLGFARHQWVRNTDDARDVFKMLRSQAIGASLAVLYYEWAALELAGGNQFKALGVVAKGLKEAAQPASLLEQMQADLQAGKFVYRPPWASEGSGNKTGHSGVSSLGAAFLTPGVLDERRSSATPSLDVTGGTAVGGATETLMINRPGPAAARQGSSLAPRPAESGRTAGGGGGDTDTLVLGGSRAAVGAVSQQQQQQQQHTAGLTDQLANRTSHTIHSGSTVGSDDPTATMRMKALSGRSGGSTGSIGEEATVSLRKPGSGGKDAGAGSSDAQRGGDDTLVINRASLLKNTALVGSASKDGSAAVAASKEQAGLLKPRRLGVLGKAQRVVPAPAGRPPLAPAAAGAGAEQPPADAAEDAAAAAAAAAEANRKRKAEMEAAQSPNPQLQMAGLGEGKRRQSPCDEVRIGRAAGNADAAAPAAAAARPVERQLPPVPRFDEQRPAAAAASQTAPDEVVTTAAPSQPPIPAAAPSRAAAAAASAKPAASRPQVVLQECGAATQGRRQAEQGDEEDETAPVVMSKLAQRVQRGRQSLAPSKIVLGGDGSLLHRSGAGTPGARPAAAAAAAPAAVPAVAAQQQARPGRRVVEDENTVTVKDIVYTKLECVGRGGSSKVYKVMAPNRKIFALKRIRLQGRDAEAASGFLDEIKLLNSLAGRSNIIQLIDSEVHRSEGLIYMVLEYGDIDLARLLQKHEKARRELAGGEVEEIDENFIRLYWEQMLQAVDTIHRERIVHSDLKPANFLVVEGQLKLIDFGIAKAIHGDTTSIARESQVGTLNYMSPEAILGGQNNIRGGPPMKVGRASDIWSLGCILYQMVYGHTPFSHLPFIQKMHAIIDAGHRIVFPPLKNAALLDVIQRCLDRNPRSRITMQELLEHPFLRPTHAAAPAAAPKPGSSVELSREQLTKLLQQVAAAGVSGSDVGHLSDQLFKQLSNGLSPDLVSRKAAAAEARSAAAASAAAHPVPAAHAAPRAAALAQPPQQQQQQPGSVAAAAAQAATARSGQRADAVAALESRPRAAAPSAAAGGRPALMPISQTAIAQQAAALRKVELAAKQPAARQPESGLEAALRKGLERFKFEDATAGEEDGNTTGGFSDP
ncbi:hypothetical protein C2E21_5938 [Chlorella sorokiniana]|uniref:Protein kinase domain-containing protein n=1 Tax=Chlorella sorokiniana TaxID=3076 RepID=A0A2P6TN06_CHLSO|nr:hypothetical protein C2E21_5938 [Chlorella sorokiniana]|eukprot:PRW45719.1 hypothetical protein C2E21_5938 [Chlorella sorokiniana]